MAYGTANVDTIQSSTAGTPVQFNDGNGTQVGTLCRAWVNFNGTTSPGTIRAQFNVSSVTKNGTGDYTINFTTALPDANYSALGTSGQGGTFCILNANDTTANTTSAVRFYSRAASTATYTDLSMISIGVFR